MITYATVIKDSLNASADSLKSLTSNQRTIGNINFDLSKIVEGNGILISVVGYVVVFLSLLLLYFVFTEIAKILQSNLRKRLKKSGKEAEANKSDLSISGEINAAISMALYLHFEELHDIENTVLTIKKVQRSYSPWSSKIYGLREYPKKY